MATFNPRAILAGNDHLVLAIGRDYGDVSPVKGVLRIASEIAYSRKICAQHGWPVIDVTRKSIEESAATIIRLLQDRQDAASGGVDVSNG